MVTVDEQVEAVVEADLVQTPSIARSIDRWVGVEVEPRHRMTARCEEAAAGLVTRWRVVRREGEALRDDHALELAVGPRVADERRAEHIVAAKHERAAGEVR